MRKKDVVSIIIPVYKTETWLPKCIESCLKQTYKKIEIILIEDGSPDQCGIICDTYANADSRIIVQHQKNAGVSNARNKGLEVAQGEYILFLDSDDWLEENAIELLMNNQLLVMSDLVVCGANYYGKNRLISQLVHETAYYNNKKFILERMLHESELCFFSTPWIKLYKKEIIDQGGIRFDESIKIGEDLVFVLEYIRYINNCSFISDCLFNIQRVTYNKNKHYQTDDIDYHWNNGKILYTHYIALYVQTGYYEEYKTFVDLYFLRMIRIFLNTTIMGNAPKAGILNKIKQYSDTEECKEIVHADINLIDDRMERIIVTCLRERRYQLLYFLFYLKIILYNRLYMKLKH